MPHYLYGIVEGGEGIPEVKLPGVEGTGHPYLISQNGLGALASDFGGDAVRATQENLLAHEQVLEEVLRERTVLPFEFGTVAPSQEGIIQMISKNAGQFRRNLSRLKDKVEFNVKIAWHNMPAIFQEIVKGHPAIAHYKREVAGKPPEATYQDRIRLGTMVAEALAGKKQAEGNRICRLLKRHALGMQLGQPLGDEMIANVSYLVQRERIGEFEQAIVTVGEKEGDRLDFKYVGPIPPYSFVSLHVKVPKHAS